MSASISTAAPFTGGNEHPAHEDHHDAGSTTTVGFWIYLMSDCVLFSGLFATYAVLAHQFAGGPTGRELFDLNFVLIETMLLLVSSLTYGLATLSMFKKNRAGVLFWLGVTFLLGAAFLVMEIYEFNHLIHEGAGRAAARSSRPSLRWWEPMVFTSRPA